MRAWRICKRRYADTAFNGEGAFRYGGRWNSHGVPVVYLGGNPSIAALEIIVNIDDSEDLYRIPYALIPVDFDESLVSRVETLPADWRQDPPPPSTAKIGDEWFRSRRSALLEVPSAVIPVERNFILSPLHEAFAQIKIGEPQKFEFDSRLVSLHRSQISEDL